MKFFLWFTLVLTVLLVAFFVAIRYPSVQTWLAQRATDYLSAKTGSRVSIEKVRIAFVTKADFINFYMEDLNGDTLIYAKELSIDFKTFSLFKKVLNVSKIKLINGTVRIARDSTGTHTNIGDLLKKFSTDEAPASTPKPSVPTTWRLDLSRLSLLNTSVRYIDHKAHLDLQVSVPTLDVSLNDFALEHRLIALKRIVIDGADVHVNLMPRIKQPDDSLKPFHFLNNLVQVTWEKLELTNSKFSMYDYNVDTAIGHGVDLRRLKISDIQLVAEDGCIVDDTISTHIRQMSAVEQSGFRLQQLTAQARVSVNDITLSDLLLKTDNSEIKNYLSLSYSDFYDFKDFLHKVKMDARLSDTKLSLRDLNFFLHKLGNIEHNTFYIDGDIRGSVSNLRGKNINVRTGGSTQFKGDFSTRGLPDIFETSLNLRIERLATTVADIQRFAPKIKIPANVSSLGLIYYTGTLDGFLTDIYSQGKLVSSIGSATTKMNFSYNKQTNKTAYSGELALNSFNLGKFFGDEINLGTVSLNTTIKGRGITLESLNDTIYGTVSQFTFRNHLYENIRVDGNVIKKSFSGKLKINDRALAMTFAGKADLSQTLPILNFEATIDSIKPKELNFGKENFFIAGKVEADFTGKNIDDITGNLLLTNVTLRRDSFSSFIKKAEIDAKLINEEEKVITVESDVANAKITGHFTIAELPKALVAFTKKTFTRLTEDTIVYRQNFMADVQIFEPGNITRIIHPQFRTLSNTHIHASFNSLQQQLDVKGFIPELAYGDFKLRKTDINASSAEGFFELEVKTDNLYSKDSLWLDTLAVAARTLDNKDIRLDVTVADKTHFNYANLTSLITPQINQALVRVEPSDVKLGNYHWTFDKGNFILINGKKISSHGLVFRSEEQRVYISSYLKNDTSTSVKVTLDNTSIADFTGIFTEKVRDVQGNVNGKIEVEDVFYKPRIFADFVVDELRLGKELIGDVNVESKLDDSGKKILLRGSIRSANPIWYYQNNVELNGYMALGEAPTIKVELDAPRIGLNFLNYKFFDKYVKDCRGYARAKATLEGPLKKPILKGDVWLINDTVTVSFLNTTYHIRNHRVRLDERGFDFGNAVAFDVRDSMLIATGRINHESFKKFNIDLVVETNNGQFLNTNEKLSPYFYGEAYGAGSVRFLGPFNLINIKASATTKQGTYCRLPITSSYETNKYTFYKFVSKDTVATTKTAPLKVNGVNFSLDVDVTPDARMDIILDPVAGDILTSYGSGNLKVEIPRGGNISMYGLYEIDRGNYLFTLQNIINKRFDISKGGAISFNGDIYKANLNVDAVYQVRTSTTDLIEDLVTSGSNSQQGGSSQNQLLAASQNRIPVRLLLNLRGALERPNIGFDIKAIDPDPTIKSYVDQRLAQLKLYENDLNKQVFGLLVMNRFLPQTFLSQSGGGNSSSGNYVGGTAANTVGELLSTQLTNYLNSLLSATDVKALQNLNINLGYKQYDQANNVNINNPTNTYDTRREIQLALQQRLLNNRLVINAGGNLDIGNNNVTQGNNGQNTGARAVIPTGDFQVEYLFTPDGTWRAKAFNRTNYDYYNSRNNNRTGIGISFRKEFDYPRELFQIKKKSKKQSNTTLQNNAPIAPDNTTPDSKQ